jgi:hypothetical protein
MADQLIVQRWLIRLGKITSARISEDDAADFIEEFSPLLAMRFGDDAFTNVSLEFVAAECKYLPTYGELVALLRDWKRQLPAPSYPALNDNVADMDAKNRHWLSYYQRREREGFTPLREKDGRLSRPDITDWREHTLSLIRQHAPDAWAYLHRDHHAA